MTKEEKEKLLDYIDDEICGDTWKGDYTMGKDDAYRNIITFIEDMPITEPKETNLEHYFDEIQDILKDGYDIAVDYKSGKPCACETFDCEKCKVKCLCKDGPNVCTRGLCKWLLQPYEKPKYKLTQFEYDLLRTNDMSHDRKVGSFATYVNMKEVGYFKDIDFDLTIKDVLENCEVVE